MSPRRYRITIQGKSYDVEVGDMSGSRVTVSVDGVAYDVELPGGTQTAAPQVPAEQPQAPRVERPAPKAQAPAQRPAAPPRPSAPSAGSGNEVRAMMPGRILSVSVQPGDAVTRGQALLVIESMKMENTVVSPRDGTVRAVHVTEGAAVQHGETLVELE